MEMNEGQRFFLFQLNTAIQHGIWVWQYADVRQIISTDLSACLFHLLSNAQWKQRPVLLHQFGFPGWPSDIMVQIFMWLV